MLVLTRKTGQRIQIGDEISITVVRLQGDQVRIGIEAPRQVSILREELVGEHLNLTDGLSAGEIQLLAAG